MTVQWYSFLAFCDIFVQLFFEKYSVSGFPWQDLDYKPKLQELLDLRMSWKNLQISCDLIVHLFLFPRCPSLLLVDYASSILGLWFSSSFGCARLGLRCHLQKCFHFHVSNHNISQKGGLDSTTGLRSMVGLRDFQHCGTGTERAALPS